MHIALSCLFHVAVVPTALGVVTTAPDLAVAMARIAADKRYKTPTRTLATNLLFFLSGDRGDVHGADSVASPEQLQFASQMVATVGRGGKFPRLALLVNFLSSSDTAAQQYGATMIARSANDHAQKTAIAAMQGPKKLCKIVASSTQADLVRAK